MAFERYESRFEAGNRVADLIVKKNKILVKKIRSNPEKFFCFAIPNGGVPVAEGFCETFNLQYDLLIVRKIKIPYNPEAGFGSVTTDGTVLLNEDLLNRLSLTKQQVDEAIKTTEGEISERLEYYNKKENLESQYRKYIRGNQIFMIDDGLASGFTMKAAIKMVKKYNPEKIFVAIPTSPLSAVKRIKPDVDDIFCPNVKDVFRFAVANAYKNWYDLSEKKVLEILQKSENYIS
jgi:predicted phosphoribosyltransferase